MGIKQWLNLEGRNSAPEPWTTNMGPLSPVRGVFVPYAWTFSTGAVIGYVLTIALPGNRSYFASIVLSVCIPLVVVPTSRRSFLRVIAAAAALSSEAPIERVRVGRVQSLRWAVATVLALLILALGAVSGDTSNFLLASGFLLAGGLGSALKEHLVARREDEQGVEFLVGGRRGVSWGYYVRPRRAPSNTEPASRP